MDAETATADLGGPEAESFLGADPGPFVEIPEGTPLRAFLTDSFVESATEFDSLAALLAATPWAAGSFAEVPRAELDRFVAEHSRFEDWAAMVRAAGEEFAHRGSY